jgi:hypothetical protein
MSKFASLLLFALSILGSVGARADSWGWFNSLGSSGHAADEGSAYNAAVAPFVAGCSPAAMGANTTVDCSTYSSIDGTDNPDVCKSAVLATCTGGSYATDGSVGIGWWHAQAAPTSDCASVSGQLLDYSVGMTGTDMGICPGRTPKTGETQWDGNLCVAVPVGTSTANCHAKAQTCVFPVGFTMADGVTKSTVFGGVAKVDNTGCAGADLAGSAKNVRADTPDKGISGGGPGVSGVGDENAAKTATNTAKTNVLLQKILDNGSVSGTGGGSCGGDGQPACKLDSEGGDATAAQMNTDLGASATAMQASYDTFIGGISYGARPDMGAASRWTLDFGPFMSYSGEAVCKVTWDLPIASQHVTMGADWCNYAPYAKDFLGWVMWIVTAFALWSMLYSPNRGA